MRVLLTGGAGFIGSHIADLLVERGHEVVLLDSLLPQAHTGIPEWTTDLVHGDVQDYSLVRDLLTGVDAVCHQAAVVGHGLDPSDAPMYVLNNDHGTAVLLAAMHAADVRRLVLASSMVVYGEGRYSCATHGTVRPGPREVSSDEFDPLDWFRRGDHRLRAPVAGEGQQV
ncbi:NAD-dependent epimerase/dehydratase family protein, partial [Kibdelosporangium lantanae]